MTVSHPPGGRLPLLSARLVVTSPAAEHHRPLAVPNYTASDRKSNALPIALPRHRFPGEPGLIPCLLGFLGTLIPKENLWG